MFKNLVIQTISLNFRLTKLKDRRLKMEKHLKVTEANMKKSIDFIIKNMTFMFLPGIPRSVFLILCGALRLSQNASVISCFVPRSVFLVLCGALRCIQKRRRAKHLALRRRRSGSTIDDTCETLEGTDRCPGDAESESLNGLSITASRNSSEVQGKMAYREG